MKKKTNSQSAFFNLRVLVGVVIFLSGVCLALAGLGTFSNASPQSKQTTSRSNAPASDAIQYSLADKEGRFVYLIEFAEKGLLHRQTLARGERFNPNTPQAQAHREEIITEQANHLQAMTKALVASLPTIMASLEGVERELERATANLPDPTYPKR